MSTAVAQHREALQRAISSREWARAGRPIKDLWNMAPGSATALWLMSQVAGIEGQICSRQHRLAILRSFTVEPLVPLLNAAALTHGIDLKVHVGGFNAWMQETLEPSNNLYAFEPDTLILAVQTRDALPELWDEYSRDCDTGAVAAALIASFRMFIQAFRSRSAANIVVHDFELPAHCADGLLDQQIQSGQAEAIRDINRRLRSLTCEFTGVFVLGYDDLIARRGRDKWHDERKWLTVGLPFAADALIHMANEWLKFIVCLAGRQAKLVVADLDNTLWGGVVGEDGPSRIKLGREYPGAAWRNVQRALLECHRRGILIALASKNNEADALPVLEDHDEMLLRPKYISAQRINWNDKAQSIREIATELNLGLDSIVFLDDNPVERAKVAIELPEVAVIYLDSDPWSYAEAIRDYPGFARLSVSSEDMDRSHIYREQRQRKALSEDNPSLEDFYRQLDQQIEVAPVSRATMARVAQLTNKANQFNLTTRRYSEPQIEEVANRPGWAVYGASVRDRFGDNGLVGVMITKTEGPVTEIDSMLLSCRVLGRTVETALLAFLAAESRVRGAYLLRGRFVPTKKNAPAADCFEKHGFVRIDASEEGSLWELDLDKKGIDCPDWIHMSRKKEPKAEFALA